jgi:sugar lactone lactonase YvrE
MTARTTTLLTDQVVFAESPSWHDGQLWFSDVHDYKLKRVALDGTVTVVTELGGRPSGCGFHPDGRLLLGTALDQKLLWIDPATGAVTPAADVAGAMTGLVNDMVVDGRGRAYFGDTGFNPARGEAPAPGRVLLFEEGQAVRVVAEDVSFPNGCAVTPDGGSLLYAESFGERVSRFTIEPDGGLSSREVFADLGEAPDGLCLDAAGAVWVGLPHSSRFVRLDVGGTIVDEIPAPAPFAVTCVFGGPRRQTLFLCSAITSLPQLANGDSDGRIDRVELAIGGAGWP